MKKLEMLAEIREKSGSAETTGLSDGVIESFLARDDNLGRVIDEAYQVFKDLEKDHGDALKKAELDLVAYLQESFVNFYSEDTVNPYVPLSARGPWIVTSHGAVVHDSGGYGMLGMGHGPDRIIQAMARNHVMANVMTANFAQRALTDRLFKEIGHTRKGDKRNPYAKFVCMNSGSESVTVASRIADLNAKQMTDKGGRYEGKRIKMLALKGGFHGRTDRPAQASDSSNQAYQVLATFRDQKNLVTVEPNNVDDLRRAFKEAEAEGIFFEFMFMEPVMGEGNPGVAVTREFYDTARELTKAHGALFLVDSIQAGLRAHGCLSICDYPGFSDCIPPDMETYSKALNAGQYPLSVLALGEETAALYKRGIYGNTMTTNPRALEVACAVLDEVDESLRNNVQERGKEFVQKLKKLGEEFPDVVTSVEGTGLLFAVGLKKEGYQVVGRQGMEGYLRRQGIGVIHGGANALRFTPHFRVTSEEVDMMIEAVRQAIKRGPVYS